jgi:hypothetical protein
VLAKIDEPILDVGARLRQPFCRNGILNANHSSLIQLVGDFLWVAIFICGSPYSIVGFVIGSEVQVILKNGVHVGRSCDPPTFMLTAACANPMEAVFALLACAIQADVAVSARTGGDNTAERSEAIGRTVARRIKARRVSRAPAGDTGAVELSQ